MADVVTSPEAIAYMRCVAIAQGLALEINTGLKHKVNYRFAAAGQCGVLKSTKRAQLRTFVDWMRKTYPHYTPSSPVDRACSLNS